MKRSLIPYPNKNHTIRITLANLKKKGREKKKGGEGEEKEEEKEIFFPFFKWKTEKQIFDHTK